MCASVTHRLMELRRNEPDFLLSVVQMMRSLKRKSERSFFPPTVFCGETIAGTGLGINCGDGGGASDDLSERMAALLTASMTISCLTNFLWGFRI